MLDGSRNLPDPERPKWTTTAGHVIGVAVGVLLILVLLLLVVKLAEWVF